MLNAAEDPHYLLKPTYQKLNDMYKNHKLNLVYAGQEILNIVQFTYYAIIIL